MIQIWLSAFVVSVLMTSQSRAEDFKMLVVQKKSESGLEQLSIKFENNDFQIVTNTGAFQLGAQRLGIYKLVPTKTLVKEFTKLYDNALEEPPVESGPHEWTLLVNGKPVSQESPHLGHTVSMIRRSLELAQVSEGALYDRAHPPKCNSQTNPSSAKKTKKQSGDSVTLCTTEFGTVYLPLMQ